MSSFQPIVQPAGTAALVVGTASSNTVIPLPASLSAWSKALNLVNSGTETVFVAWGPTSAITATAPVAGTPGSLPIAPNSSVTITVTNCAYVAAKAAATGNTLYVTAGVNYP